jgi:hypothetical protein
MGHPRAVPDAEVVLEHLLKGAPRRRGLTLHGGSGRVAGSGGTDRPTIASTSSASVNVTGSRAACG